VTSALLPEPASHFSSQLLFFPSLFTASCLGYAPIWRIRCGLMYKRCIRTFSWEKWLRMWGRRLGSGQVSIIGIISADLT
jgi:hypothetical protein